MGRFLVIGAGPLLDDAGTTLVSGQCLRTMHFVRPMKEAGHEVNLATVPIPGCESTPAQGRFETRKYEELLQYKAFTTADETAIVKMLRQVLERHEFDGAIGINPYPAYLLARADPSVPFWADLNGWTMAEGQTRATRLEHDRDYDHFWRVEVAALLAADRFSTVSIRQGDALYGELALVGRLNSLTFSWPFTTAIPNAVYPIYEQLERTPETPVEGFPPDAHTVLWSGGFNTWTDIDLLIQGVAQAMERNPRLHFLSTGGAVHGHDERTYTDFQTKAAQRWPEGRYKLLGWVETDKVLALHARAAVGINIDSANTETRFGARNRLTNMLGAGLPVLTTRGTEIAEWIEDNNAGTVIPTGDAEALAAALMDSAEETAEWEHRAHNARALALRTFRPGETLTQFLEWCEKPGFSPDRNPTGSTAMRQRVRSLNRELEARQWANLKLNDQVRGLMHDRASLKALRRKWPMRIYYHIKRLGKPE